MLNRPERRNAISPAMVADLERAFAACARGPARVLILTGAGPAFCGGMDLAALQASAGQPLAAHRKDARRLASLLKTLYTFPLPTIAAVNGAAIAGGCGLATLCDFVFASREATFGYPEVKIGFIPALVSSFLVRQVGDRRARELLLSGRTLGAEEALRLGMITDVVEPAQLMERTRELGTLLASHSPASLRETKALLNRSGASGLDTELEDAARASARVRTSGDFREGLAAFLEKRRPRWRSD
jgi:methylglutaconyl-CoA hydratase